ncbi:neutral/alkaline non-lysosomal ceramidase N-terminal domain-containing protein [Facklamia sp. DSM 111018]|uniref:Neutral ceramidase n=1 Tax=Facklamia lactis TaxID=2749967 RepID=A0ABS0LP92_9LACT|nr:neutral/alkaline non-lysosomal ceramidase N-terminal domain-containing protein [Facklamia lactis]MBG9979544.1 neutral/alkaline non-lysosomal ceramidase N-terminal domain-containing protein [Facklamia lactis]MBG9985787.1 neutral/alkaline non-lysosomal ceramidase N-terminal domain-containing protein [Facklamia lactis]
MQIGFARKTITPNGSELMGGYSVENRYSEGVMDELYVKVVILQHPDATVVLVNYDLVAVDDLLVQPIVEYLKQYQISQDLVVVTATHTHASIGGILETRSGILQGSRECFMLTNLELIDHLLDTTYEAIEEALQGLSEGKLAIACDQMKGIGSNRNNRQQSGDSDLLVVKLINQTGYIYLIKFACHPTVLDSDNRYFSADFPGVVSQMLEEEGACFSCFLNGAAGDLSTRFTRQASNAQEMKRLGRLIVDKISQLHLKVCQVKEIESRNFSHSLRVKSYLPEKQALMQVEKYQMLINSEDFSQMDPPKQRQVESKLEGAICHYHLTRNQLNKDEITIDFKIIRFNEMYFILIPGELFSQLGHQLERKQIQVIGYANGYYGYFPDERAYEAEYYEANATHFAPGESEQMVQEIADYVQDIKEERDVNRRKLF